MRDDLCPDVLASAEILISSVMPPHQLTSGYRMSAQPISRSIRNPYRVASCSPVEANIPCGRSTSS